MEEIQNPTLKIEEDEEEEIITVENDEDFYENIEAPKFVDFNTPDRLQPVHNDRYWFCLRVGCDQKHEEEMDSEKIYNNFVLRVMAARSPNIRLRKAMYRQENSKNLKCPLTVPAKPSKSRISRLVMISSINQKIVNTPKLGETPNVKTKQSVVRAKALTTPRCNKKLSHPNAFRSVGNPKPKTIDLPKNKGIAKALVFHSPKKTVKVKTPVELRSSLKNLCSEMKKLKVVSGKNQLLAKEASRKKFRGREVKSRVFDSLHSQNHKRKEAKSSDMDIDTKSKNVVVCLKKKDEDIVEALSESSIRIASSLSSSEEKNASKDGIMSEGSPEKEKITKVIEKDDEKENLLTVTDDNKTDGEIMESDDKENCSASDENRQPNLSHKPAEKKKNIGKNGNFKSIQKVSGRKAAKENSNSAAVGPQLVKYRKTKLTTPKPFRLRTDERGILKEASEKKHRHALLGETADTVLNNQPVSSVLNNQPNKVDTSSGLKSSKREVQTKLLVTPPQRESNKETERLNSSVKRTKPLLMKQLEKSQGKSMVSVVKPGQQLGAIEENSTKIPRLKKVAKVKAFGVSPSPTPPSLSHERRPTTIPKAPNFHSIHTPKSCTRNLASARL